MMQVTELDLGVAAVRST